MSKVSPQKAELLGGNLTMFNDMLRHRLPEFQYFLNDIAVHEGNGTIAGLVNAMLDRLDGAQRPFHVKSQYDLVERILSDGFYAAFHLRWLQYFNRVREKIQIISKIRLETTARN